MVKRAFVLAAFSFLTLPAAPVRADPPCPVPEGLGLGVLRLPAARHAIAIDKRLAILTLGGAQTAGAEAGDQDATYPARLEAALRDSLPDAGVTVMTEATPNYLAAEMPARIAKLLPETGARLVIWAPGGGDVARRTDPVAFQRSLREGIAAAHASGADLILIDVPFMPSPDRMARIEPYRRAILAAAGAAQVPVLRRHDLMRLWNEDRTLDLAARDGAERQGVARRLFACIARALAVPIAAAVR